MSKIIKSAWNFFIKYEIIIYRCVFLIAPLLLVNINFVLDYINFKEDTKLFIYKKGEEFTYNEFYEVMFPSRRSHSNFFRITYSTPVNNLNIQVVDEKGWTFDMMIRYSPVYPVFYGADEITVHFRDKPSQRIEYYAPIPEGYLLIPTVIPTWTGRRYDKLLINGKEVPMQFGYYTNWYNHHYVYRLNPNVPIGYVNTNDFIRLYCLDKGLNPENYSFDDFLFNVKFDSFEINVNYRKFSEVKRVIINPLRRQGFTVFYDEMYMERTINLFRAFYIIIVLTIILIKNKKRIKFYAGKTR